MRIRTGVCTCFVGTVRGGACVGLCVCVVRARVGVWVTVVISVIIFIFLFGVHVVEVFLL